MEGLQSRTSAPRAPARARSPGRTCHQPPALPPTPALQHYNGVRIPAGTKISRADVTQLAGAAAITALGGHKRWEVGLSQDSLQSLHDSCSLGSCLPAAPEHSAGPCA